MSSTAICPAWTLCSHHHVPCFPLARAPCCTFYDSHHPWPPTWRCSRFRSLCVGACLPRDPLHRTPPSAKVPPTYSSSPLSPFLKSSTATPGKAGGRSEHPLGTSQAPSCWLPRQRWAVQRFHIRCPLDPSNSRERLEMLKKKKEQEKYLPTNPDRI